MSKQTCMQINVKYKLKSDLLKRYVLFARFVHLANDYQKSGLDVAGAILAQIVISFPFLHTCKCFSYTNATVRMANLYKYEGRSKSFHKFFQTLFISKHIAFST